MQNDKLRDFLKFFRSHLPWFILSAGFFAVILISALFLSTKYVVDTATNTSEISIPSPTAQVLEVAAEPEVPAVSPAPVATLIPPTAPAAPLIPASPLPIVMPNSQEVPETISSQEYVVKAGDTLWSIAERNYQSGYFYKHISRENKLTNPGMIEVGQKLVIPNLTAEEKTAVFPTPQNQKGEVTDSAWSDDETVYKDYVIIKGDSLWKIAEAELGDPYRWVELYQTNKAVIGVNPDLIYPDVVLKVPTDSVSVVPTSSSDSYNWTSSLLQ